MDHEQEGWNAYRLLVMDTMTKSANQLETINKRLARIEADIAGLQVKSGIWGAIAGVIATLAILLVAFASNAIGG